MLLVTSVTACATDSAPANGVATDSAGSVQDAGAAPVTANHDASAPRASAGTGAAAAVNTSQAATPTIAPTAPQTSAPAPPTQTQPQTRDQFTNVGTQPFVLAAHDPFSTFAADVDTASYDIFRRNVERAIPTDPASIRVEEFINYFHYDDSAPRTEAEHPFEIHAAISDNPLGRDSTFLRVSVAAVDPPPLEKKPTNLVFLVDTSGSMLAEDKLPLVQYVLTHTLDVLAPQDKVSIVSYAGSTAVRLQPTAVSEKQRITEVINTLSAGGSTNGAGGIQLAYEQARSAFIENGINHVILCTDGDFNVGVSDTDSLVELIQEQRKTGVTLTALGFGTGNLNDAMMEKVSNAGDGMYSVISSQTQAGRYAEERLLRTFVHVAKDLKIQLEWNPERVSAYRLIGYEDRAIADTNFRNDAVDAGEIGAGHRVTALYEVVRQGAVIPEAQGAPPVDDGEPVAGAREVAADDLVLIKVRYKQPGATESDPAREVVSHVLNTVSTPSFAEANDDLRWTVAIAAFAELLKQSPYAAPTALGVLREVFSAQSERDVDREEFLDLFDSTRGSLTQQH